MEEQFIFFWDGPFSQWHPSNFVIDGVEYNCAEQYMMAEKARLFKDKDAEEKIMESIHQPAVQKAWGKKVRNFDVDKWNEVCKDVVYRANYAKFTQNEKLGKYLHGSIGKTIVEASPYDVIWGIGLGENDPRRFDRKQWRGKNWLGEVVMKVRDDLYENIEGS